MGRFWIFPLILGVVGALYPVLCTVQGLVALVQFSRWPTGSLVDEVVPVFVVAAPYGFGIGVLMGLVVAARELARFGAGDRSGMRAAQRLIGNLWWINCYALGFCGGTFGVAAALVRLGWVSARVANDFFPGTFFVAMGIVNFAAIVWAARRTALADDVLSPRVLWEKMRDSTQMTPREIKTSRFD